MSTIDLFFPQEAIEGFVQETLASDDLIALGYGEDDYGVCPYISFYIYHDVESAPDITHNIVDIYEEFLAMASSPMAKIYKNSTEVWLKPGDKRLPEDIRKEAIKSLHKRDNFWFGATDRKHTSATPIWSISGLVEESTFMSYTVVKMIFSHSWYNENKQSWHQFVHSCIDRLKPEHCYSGFEVSSGPLGIMGNYEAETTERILVDYFYGLDIDHNLSMHYHSHEEPPESSLIDDLGAGIRTPTWCFMLSPYWLNQLGKTEMQVREALNHPNINITAFPYPVNEHNPDGINGLWIQLGELDLYPVGKGKPELLVKANELIKPIRCDELSLTSFESWSDDPNPRFDEASGIKWMRRFDNDSDWLYQRVSTSPVPEGIFAAKAGESVPKSGVWFAPVLGKASSAQYLELGQVLPTEKTNAYGEELIWYLLEEDQP